MEIEPEFGFHGGIREVDLLRSRIAELEDGNEHLKKEIERLKEYEWMYKDLGK